MSEEEMEKKNTIHNQKARHRQHGTIEHRHQKTGQVFDNLGLTKRNTEYMYQFNKEFADVKMDDAKKQKIIHKMIHELLVNQRKGLTARRMYGTVKHKIHTIVHPPKKVVPLNKNYWPNAIYNMLIFFIIFNLLYGITYMISSKMENQQGAAGFVGLVITSVVAGLGMPIMTRLFDDRIKHKYNGFVRFLIMIGLFLAWMAVFYLSALLPRPLNPVFSPWVNIALAVISIAAAFWVHHKYNVSSAFHARPRR
ncbi:DUF1129 domain-containing protein [Acetilactobacillus jinshanensis]|uniref:DUF1129 domain-containing protein n=2 Tax=Bacteria TaxID=2 RepID=A0A4P6ZJR1_9LACO|nr:DUF1129 domain-containing protein [Acetilactobacillus jinshanensis]QBP17717.1 DUF1129 domain-containing protein [Acetilactobacillus jinshanensis]URL61739.1 DUF1129 domain-containing protein [uncultured bacterium]